MSVVRGIQVKRNGVWKEIPIEDYEKMRGIQYEAIFIMDYEEFKRVYGSYPHPNP